MKFFLLLFLLFFIENSSFYAQKAKINALENNLKEAEKTKNFVEMSKIQMEIGDVYFTSEDYKRAIKTYKRALETSEENKNYTGVAIANNKLGLVATKKNDNKDAISYFEKGLTVARANNLTAITKEISKNLNDLNAKIAQEKQINAKYEDIKSLKKEDVAQIMESENKKKQEELLKEKKVKLEKSAFLDKIKNLSTSNQLIALKLEYNQKEIQRNELEIQRNDLQINLLNKDRELKTIEIAKKDTETKIQKTIIWSSIFVILLLVVLAVFIYRGYLQKQIVNKLLVQKNKEIEHKNKEILDSITYAKRIQSAILPQPKLVKEYFKDSFILYKPKDIVAGDFYWIENTSDKIMFAAADCTGHGVPGAMVSVVCNNSLNRAVREFGLKNPAKILDKTRDLVIEEFDKSADDVKDGMDISLCVIDNNKNLLNWSGAHNPVWIVRNSKIIEYKGDKQPIGKFAHAHDFTLHTIELEKNDTIYIFTDGLQDQFGGPSNKIGGKKFKTAQFKELLLSIKKLTMDEQRIKIEEAFNNWKGDLDQVDDVCVIGVRL